MSVQNNTLVQDCLSIQTFQISEHVNNQDNQEPTSNVAVFNSPETNRQGLKCVLSGFFSNFTVFGIAFTFGIFQEFYRSENGPLRFENPAGVAIIGTLASSVTYMGGIFQPTLRKHFPTYVSMGIGSAVLSLGLILASFCSKTWQFALTQGLMFGIGASMTYLPPVIFTPQYYVKYRGIAMGIVFSGTGFGSLAFAFLSQYLIHSIGWRWALRVLGLVALCITSVCSRFAKPHPNYRNNSHSTVIQVSVLKSPLFHLQMLCGLFQSMAYLIPLVYMATYGTTLGFTSNQGATFIAVNNVVNAASKILLGLCADYIGRANMLFLCCTASMITVYGLWLIPTKGTFVSFVVLYGIVSGPIISLLPACLSETFGVQVYYSVSGMLYLFRGIGNFLGSPIAGLLINDKVNKPSGYFNTIQYAGAALATSAICSFLLAIFSKTSGKKFFR